LPHAPLGGWGTFRYVRSLARWLREHRHSVDVVYVMNLRHEAYAAIGALRNQGVGVVLRPRPADCRWIESVSPGARLKRRFLQADALVASSDRIRDDLLRVGYPAERIPCIRNGAWVGARKDAVSRYQARAALAEINQDLTVAEYAPVAVTAGPLCEERHLFDLVAAWRTVGARWPSARLWLLGDGPLREALYERIVDCGLHHQISLPGSFDDLTDVFQAADVFVAPTPATEGAQFALEAMAAGLPVVAADGPDYREVVAHGASGLLVPPGDGPALAKALTTLFDAPQLAAQWGSAGRRRVADDFSPARTAQLHLELFQRIVAGKRRVAK
jgi:glycosyltransferase involved in cell wall biosynthesis